MRWPKPLNVVYCDSFLLLIRSFKVPGKIYSVAHDSLCFISPSDLFRPGPYTCSFRISQSMDKIWWAGEECLLFRHRNGEITPYWHDEDMGSCLRAPPYTLHPGFLGVMLTASIWHSVLTAGSRLISPRHVGCVYS